MWIPGLTLLETYFVVGFGLGAVMTLLLVLLIVLVKNL
jgi:hypothetical protein